MEIQRSEVAYPRSHSLFMAELQLNPCLPCSELDWKQIQDKDCVWHSGHGYLST